MSIPTGYDPSHWPLGRLLSTAARLVEQEWNAWLAERGLTHAGLLVLHALDWGPRTQREIATWSMVEEQTMSRVLDRLERTGHVTRERDPHDRRRVIVRRTGLGTRAYHAAVRADVADQIVRERVADPDGFRAALIGLIEQLSHPAPDELPAHSHHGLRPGAQPVPPPS